MWPGSLLQGWWPLHCSRWEWNSVLPCGGCSFAKSCPTLWDPMDCSTPGFPVLHHLLEFAQTRVYWVGDAIQPSRPLSPPSPPVFNLSQHQCIFQWVVFFASGSQSIGASASILPMNIQGWFPLGLTGLVLQSKGLFKNLLQHHSSKAPILHHSAFLMVELSHGYISWTLSKSLRALCRQAVPVLQREETNVFHQVKQLGLDLVFRKELEPWLLSSLTFSSVETGLPDTIKCFSSLVAWRFWISLLFQLHREILRLLS